MKVSTLGYYRKQVHLTQKELAQLADVKHSKVTYIEHGGNFSADDAHRLARALAQKGLDYGAVLAELVNPETRTKTFVYRPQAAG